MTPPGRPEDSGPVAHTRAKVFRNTLALAIGRNLIAISRLAVVILIARRLGTDVFGQYAVLIALLTIAEGVVDFGTSEVYVREISREPDRRRHLLRVLTAGRLVQVPAAFAVLMAIVVVVGYPTVLVEAAAVGGLSLVFLGGAMVFRVVFRADLTMEREVAAELSSVVVMVAGIFWVASFSGGIVAVMTAYTLSRAAYFLCGAALGRREFTLSLQGVRWNDIRHSALSCGAIGAAGFLVMVYDPLDVLMLSKLGSVRDVAHYSAAQRLAWPLLMVLSAVGGTLYSVVSSAWPRNRAGFETACQRGYDTVWVAGAFAASGALAGAEFLLGLIGPAMVDGAPAFRVLVVLCLVKAVSMTIGPVLLVVHEQRRVLAFIALALATKAIAFYWVVPRHGFVGVAWAALAVETSCVMVPSLVLAARRTGLRLRHGLALRVLTIGAASAAAAHELAHGGTLIACLVGPALYLALIMTTGTLRWSQIRALLPRRRAAIP